MIWNHVTWSVCERFPGSHKKTEGSIAVLSLHNIDASILSFVEQFLPSMRNNNKSRVKCRKKRARERQHKQIETKQRNDSGHFWYFGHIQLPCNATTAAAAEKMFFFFLFNISTHTLLLSLCHLFLVCVLLRWMQTNTPARENEREKEKKKPKEMKKRHFIFQIADGEAKKKHAHTHTINCKNRGRWRRTTTNDGCRFSRVFAI